MKKKKTPQPQQHQPEEDNDSDESDCDDDNDNCGFHVTVEINQNNEFIFKDLIGKVRKIAKIFRKSPTKNTILQKYVKEEIGRELNLILDCSTR